MTHTFKCERCGAVIYTSERPFYEMWKVQILILILSIWHWLRCPGPSPDQKEAA